MIKAIIFDCFGVLIGDGFDTTYRLFGGDPVKDKMFVEELLDSANRGQITSAEFRRQICKRLGITADEYADAIRRGEGINLELLDYIKKLRADGYKTAILSNVNKGGLERRLGSEILSGHFDATVVSGEVGYIKPEPEIYHMTAEKLGVQVQECVFVDDREPYVQAADQLGMKAVLYKDFSQMKAELEKILSAGPDN